MFARLRRTHQFLAAAAGVVATVTVVALLLPDILPGKYEAVKDRDGFIPKMKYQPLPGKAVGLLVSDILPVQLQQGEWCGPADELAFSRDGKSYCQIYIPGQGGGDVRDLQVHVGEGVEDKIQVYRDLDLANPKTVKRWGITVPYALVEVEVNGGKGAPTTSMFVATNMKRLDDTPEYALNVSRVIADLRKRYQSHFASQQKTVEAAMAKEEWVALEGRERTGPRETSEVMYVTWMAASQQLSIRFRTRISDGAYLYGWGPAIPRDRPPPGPGTRYGISYTAELGMAFEVNKDGEIVRTLILPIKTSHQKLNPPA